jgi:hypothetical protein
VLSLRALLVPKNKYWCQRTNTDVLLGGSHEPAHALSHFTCFPGTKVQELTYCLAALTRRLRLPHARVRSCHLTPVHEPVHTPLTPVHIPVLPPPPPPRSSAAVCRCNPSFSR